MSDSAYYILEPVPQSHETERGDLENEEVMTLPVVGGPYDTWDEAVDKAGSDYIPVEYHK